MGDAEEDNTKKHVQALVTFSAMGIIAYMMWNRLDAGSRFLLVAFAGISAISIYNGTWMMNARDLRRQQRDERRQLLHQGKKALFG